MVVETHPSVVTQHWGEGQILHLLLPMLLLLLLLLLVVLPWVSRGALFGHCAEAHQDMLRLTGVQRV